MHIHNSQVNNVCLLTRACDHLCAVDSGDLDNIEQYTSSPDPPTPVEFLELAEVIMEQENLHTLHNVGEALNLYITLLNAIDDSV